jgi:hypothetical protein
MNLVDGVLHFTLTNVTQTLRFDYAGVPGPQGPQGLQGIQGPVGPSGGAAFVIPSGEALSSYRAVRMSDGTAYYCDGSTANHAGTCIGVTITAAILGDDVSIQSIGEVFDPTFALTEGPLFVGAMGVLSPTPGTAFAQEIARATSTTSLFVNIQPAITKV